MKYASTIFALLLGAGCGDPKVNAATDGSTGGDMAMAAVDKQLPPASGRADISAWLGKGYYKAFHCEAMPHASRSPSPHGMNRICSNDVLSAAGAGEYPVDSAAVKELYDAMGANIVGYATYRHVKAGTTGDTWYWYETVPAGSPAPHEMDGTVADGLGGSGPAQMICVGCHAAAGSDAGHSGHDFVYTQIK